VNPLDFRLEGFHEQLHQERHFVLRPTPIFGTEGKDGEVLNAPIEAGPDNLTQGVNTLCMTSDPWHETLSRPTPVAVHDYRDMPRNLNGLGHTPRGARKRQSHHVISA